VQYGAVKCSKVHPGGSLFEEAGSLLFWGGGLTAEPAEKCSKVQYGAVWCSMVQYGAVN